MFSIGDFARLGRVSVRMLRHYDAIGLLRPARVDPATGYRFYGPEQLARLNRLIALKDLGFTLHQVGEILDAQVGPEELRGMLRLRRAELAARIEADAARLTGVEARLRLIESEGHMNAADIVVKPVGAVRLAELTATADSYTSADIGPAIQPLYAELGRRLHAAGVRPTGPNVAYYEDGPDGTVVVHAGVPVDVAPGVGGHPGGGDFAVVDLPAVERVAALVHHGPMDTADASWQSLTAWAAGHGHRTVGYAREVYLSYGRGEPDSWVTEMQVEIG